LNGIGYRGRTDSGTQQPARHSGLEGMRSVKGVNFTVGPFLGRIHHSTRVQLRLDLHDSIAHDIIDHPRYFGLVHTTPDGQL
jgi:hypothetical protein